MIATEPSLADLAAASGLEPRTIRSWVAQGLVPAPLTRGPAARYPSETTERVLAIRAMRDVLGMSLPDIRRELLVATPEQIRSHAARLKDTGGTLARHSAPAGSSALDYLAALRARAGAAIAPAIPAPDPVPGASAQGFGALEHRLGDGRAAPARKARAEEWLRIPVTPDVELTVRAPLEPEQRVRLERCADFIRDILLGRDQ